ncbi:MAG: radical SAM protein [bacterium]|nr:radical SAM protein [bacterium]
MKKEFKGISLRKHELEEFMGNFKDMPDRLLKYCEILLEGKDASPYCFQDTMSFRHIGVGLTSKCNKHCVWCYRFDPMYKNVLNKELPFEKLEKIVNNTKGKFRMVKLGGLGEPILYPRLLDAIALVRKLSDRVRITSNASLLNKNLINKMIESGLTDIEVSILTFDEKEEMKLRGVGLKDSIKKVIYISNETNLKTQVNTIVSSLGFKSLFSIVDALRGAKKLSLHTIPLFETQQCRDAGVRRVSDEEYKALLTKIKTDIDKYNLDWQMFPSPVGSVIDPVIEMKKKKNICFSCFEDPYISEIGEFVSCGRTKPFGGIDATIGFERAWNGKKLLEFRQNMLKGNYPALCGQLCYLKEKNIKRKK